MIQDQRLGIRVAGFVCAFLLVFAAVPPAHAVAVAVVNSAGAPVAGQRVTIVFPDGSTEQRDTDEKGMVIFPDRGKGDYRIEFPGGSMVHTIGGGIPLWAYGVGIAAVGAVAAGSGNSDGASDTTTSTGGGGSSGGSSSVDLNGSATLTATISSNPDSHPNFFSGATITFTTTGTSVSATLTNGSLLSATLSGSVSAGGSFTLSGSGTYAGYSTTFDFTGTFTDSTNALTGTLRAGVNGSLPDTNINSVGDPIAVTASGTVTPSP